MKKLWTLALVVFCATGCKFGGNQEFFQPDLDVIPVEYDDEYIFLDLSTGKKAVGSQVYDDATFFHGGFALVTQDDVIRIVNKNFQPISKGGFSQATLVSDGIAYVVEPAGHIVAMDQSGKALFYLKDAEMAYLFHDGVSVFCNEEGRYGLVNTDGRILIAPSDFVDMAPIGDGGMICAALSTNAGKKWGVISYDKKEVIPFEYDSIVFGWETPETRGKNAFIVEEDEGLGAVDLKNKQLVSPEYSTLILQRDGNFYFEKYYSSKGESRSGWLDKNGEEMIAPLFSDAFPFTYSNYTLAEDPSEEKYGIIDKKGEWIFDPKFQSGTSFQDNKLAVVMNKAEEFGVIDEKGEFVIKPRYDRLEYLGKGLYVARNDGAEGIVNSKGESVIKMSDLYDFFSPDYDLSDHGAVSSEYVDVEGIVGKMMQDIGLLNSDSPSREQYAKKFGVDLDEYGRRTLKSESKRNYDVVLSAFSDYESDYSFYDGYYLKRYLTELVVDFSLDYGKVSKSLPAIYNELAKRLGAASRMNSDRTVSGDPSFKPSFIKGCHATLSDDLTLYIYPDSGKIY